MRKILLFLLLLLFFVPVASAINLTDGLISYWAFNISSGTTSPDSLLLYNGTASNERVFGSDGKINYSADFTQGNDKIVQIPNDVATSTSGTHSVWFKINSYATNYGNNAKILYMENTAGYFHLKVGNDGIEYDYYTAVPTRIIYRNTSISLDTWYHSVITWDTTATKIYINGNLVYTGDGDGMDANAKGLVLGKGRDGDVTYPRYYDGWLDEFGYWNRALNSTEITALYDSGDGFSYPFTTPEPEPEPTLKNITFGLYDDTNNISLSGFFYDYNGTTYFSSGTGQTRTLNYSILYNVSFTKTGYDDVDYLNVNISEVDVITGFTDPIPEEVVNMSNISFTAVDDANSSINGFSVSVNNGLYFGTATGTELILSIPENDTINQLFNLSYSKFGYYTSTYEDINLSALSHEGVLVVKTYAGDESLDDKAVIWIIFALVACIGVSAIFSKPMLIVFGFSVMFLTYFLGGNIMVSYYWFNPLGYILGAVIILTGMMRLGFGD